MNIRSILAKVLFEGSASYWKKRYASGGNSGDGSYNKLAEFKARVVNNFVLDNHIATVAEFGCGDGAQLKLYNFKHYIGIDVSSHAIALCKALFSQDLSKRFYLPDEAGELKAELILSVDVIFHLVEDKVFERYMNRIFEASDRYVIIYSSNTNINSSALAPHVRHCKFTDWIDRKRPDFKLISLIKNIYPFKGDTKEGSSSDFYIYSKAG